MDPDRLRLYGQILNVVVIVAAIAATTFPILYAFSTWNKSMLGRVLMFNSIVTAFLVDMLVVSRFKVFGVEVSFLVYVIGFILFACTKSAMSVAMWRINHRKGTKDERARSRTRST